VTGEIALVEAAPEDVAPDEAPLDPEEAVPAEVPVVLAKLAPAAVPVELAEVAPAEVPVEPVEVAPAEVLVEPVNEAPADVLVEPVDVAPEDADDVLAPMLGSKTITGLLWAEAAELADAEEDTRGEALGPWLRDLEDLEPLVPAVDPPCLFEASTTALTLFKDVKACFEKILLKDGTLKADTAFPELPDDRGAT